MRMNAVWSATRSLRAPGMRWICVAVACGWLLFAGTTSGLADEIPGPFSTDASFPAETWPPQVVIESDHPVDEFAQQHREFEPEDEDRNIELSQRFGATIAPLWDDLPLLPGSRRAAEPVVIRGQQPETAAIVPLISRGPVDIVPVKSLNPLALIGNPAKWRGRFRAAYGSNFDGRSMIYGNFILNSGAPLGIDSEFIFREDKKLRLADQQFWNGDFNLVYHLTQIRYLMFRMGIGMNWLTDGTTDEYGFNSTYGFDISVKKPWYISTTIDWGTLGSEEMFHWHISGGLDFRRFELFIGYDFFEIRNRERKNIIAGAGFWF